MIEILFWNAFFLFKGMPIDKYRKGMKIANNKSQFENQETLVTLTALVSCLTGCLLTNTKNQETSVTLAALVFLFKV